MRRAALLGDEVEVELRRSVPWGLIAGLVVGVALRVVLLRGPGAALDGDEAITGILARSASHGHIQWFFPGQYYQGTLEALVLVPLRAVFGDSALLVKLITMLCWLAASLFIDAATVRLRLAPRWVAFTLMWCWSSGMVRVSTDARTGYGSGLVLIAVGYWAWTRAVVDREQASLGWLAASGVALGAAIWQSPTFLGAALAVGIAALVVRPSRSVTRLATLAGSMAIGVAPLVVYNALHDWGGLTPPPQPPTTLWQRFDSVTTQLIPRSLGLRLFEGPWSLGGVISKVVLGGIVVVVGWSALTVWRAQPASRALVLGLVFGVATLSVFTTSWYFDDSRYAISLMPPLVVLVAGAVSKLGAVVPSRWVWVRQRDLVAASVAVWILVLAIVPGIRQGWLRDADDVRWFQSSPNQLAGLAHFIHAHGYRCALGSYWVSHPLDYLSEPTVHAEPLPMFPVRFPPQFNAIASSARYVVVAKRTEHDHDTIVDSIDLTAWVKRRSGPYDVYLPLHPAPPRAGSLC